MAAFEYTALDIAGKQTKGILEGDTPRQVRQLLREKKLIPIDVEGVNNQPSKKTLVRKVLSFNIKLALPI